jgi:hypothetical protein
MQALCSKYGTDTALAVGDALQDYAERKMRAGIAALPDGTYRFADTYDSPELARALDVSVEITIAGSEMRLHFDSPPQVRAGINMIYTALLSSVYYAVKAVVDPTILPNSGLARPITVTAPLGTVMNATHPAAVNGRTSTCQRADLVIGALAQAAPERCIAAGNGSCATASFSGIDPQDGHLWVYLETIGGGSGARANKDGLDGVHVHMTNTSNLPVEALEVEYPLSVLRYELVDGSGGAGRFRGGMGLRRVYRAEAECHLRVDGSRLLTPPWGLAGGQPGGCGAFRFGRCRTVCRRERQTARRRYGRNHHPRRRRLWPTRPAHRSRRRAAGGSSARPVIIVVRRGGKSRPVIDGRVRIIGRSVIVVGRPGQRPDRRGDDRRGADDDSARYAERPEQRKWRAGRIVLSAGCRQRQTDERAGDGGRNRNAADTHGGGLPGRRATPRYPATRQRQIISSP